MRKFIEYLRQKIRAKRLNVFLLFLALAFVISMLSKLSSPRMHTLQFELQPSKLPQQELLVQDPLPKLDVTVTTNGFNILKIAFQKIKQKDIETKTKNRIFLSILVIGVIYSMIDTMFVSKIILMIVSFPIIWYYANKGFKFIKK